MDQFQLALVAFASCSLPDYDELMSGINFPTRMSDESDGKVVPRPRVPLNCEFSPEIFIYNLANKSIMTTDFKILERFSSLLNRTFVSLLDEEVVLRAISADMNTEKAIAFTGGKKCREFEIRPIDVEDVLTNLFKYIVYDGVTLLPWKDATKIKYHRAFFGEWTLYYTQKELNLIYMVGKQYNGYSKVLYSPNGHQAKKLTDRDFEIKECKMTTDFLD
jgi:hypothetical protein